MSTTVKIWASDEPEPSGDKLTNLTSAPPNWFREEPAHAAELYGLERGSFAKAQEFKVFILDDEGVTHHFLVKAHAELVAHVRPL